jgi:hypothetical protein
MRSASAASRRARPEASELLAVDQQFAEGPGGWVPPNSPIRSGDRSRGASGRGVTRRGEPDRGRRGALGVGLAGLGEAAPSRRQDLIHAPRNCRQASFLNLMNSAGVRPWGVPAGWDGSWLK